MNSLQIFLDEGILNGRAELALGLLLISLYFLTGYMLFRYMVVTSNEPEYKRFHDGVKKNEPGALFVFWTFMLLWPALYGATWLFWQMADLVRVCRRLVVYIQSAG